MSKCIFIRKCRQFFPIPPVLDGEHFLFGQFLKLPKLLKNFLSNGRIVKYGEKLYEKKKLCAIRKLIPNIAMHKF